MGVNGVEIRPGQVWRDRSGRAVEIEGPNTYDLCYCWVSTQGLSYTDNGIYDPEVQFGPFDLIELISDPDAVSPAGDPHEAATFHPLHAEPGAAINPKDAIGSTKLPMHLWPAEATALGCLGMMEGDEKYGRNNYIAGQGVVCSIYIDAAKRHLDAWFAGEECAPDSGIPHLANALASIAIIVKARAHGRLIDDRDYSPEPGGSAYRRFVDSITPHVKRVKALFADKHPRRYTIADTPVFERKKADDTEGGAA